MERTAERQSDDPVRGIMLIVAAMVFFSMSDATAKFLGQRIPPIEVVWLRYAGFTILMVPALIRHPSRLRSAAPLLQIGRGLGLLGSALFFTSGLRYLAMADATAMSFVSPLFITALSIPVLKEKVGIRRWSAIVVGLVGVLIVVRPGTSTFNPASVLPLLSSVSWAFGIVLTRKMTQGSDHTVTTLAYAAITGLVVTSLILPFIWEPPSWQVVALGGFIACVSTTAQWLVVLGYRRASASVLAPFSYTQLVWSSLAGFLLFDMIPDSLTLVGASIIIASGLYTAHRERIVARQRLAGSA
ncbi:DMT transporter permease [Aliidongia dinghuensis]|uniref:DMT transporter permease n=2 Tax=Aliidongia dinghuensis TaxID=1867774 RepID=A0A8J3E428_9PROT|nr:DMT transporter permease [Aliidongia dinghuensis]